MEELDKQDNNKPKRDEKGRLLPGNTANPDGRPKGKTIKEMVKDYLEENPEDMKAFVTHFVKKNRELAWQMLEGRPTQDLTTAGKEIPQPILNVYSDHSNPQDTEDDQEDKVCPGGDCSK